MAHECIMTEIEHQFPVSLIQTGFDRFSVVYGKQERRGLNYAEAAAEYGACVMHALACAGRLDNRSKLEARKAGDTRPLFEA